MRKVLALVLALAMVLGCFASVFATSYSDVAADAKYATAVNVLSDLGVIGGYNDGTYKPDQTVTRAEMAKLLIVALGFDAPATTTTNYPDVPSTYWASGYIAYATTLGIIQGYTNGNFGPKDPVTYDQAITMVVRALGYTDEALGRQAGEPLTAYIMKAQEMKLLKNVSTLGSAGAKRGDVAQMIYNAIDEDIVKYSKLLETWTSTGETMLDRLGATPDANIVVTGGETAAIDLTDYIGKYVTPYTDDGEIVAVKVLSTTLTGTYKSSKFAGTAFATSYDTSEMVQFENGEPGTCALADATTLEVALSSGKISAVYSQQKWVGTTDFAAEDPYNAKTLKLTVGSTDYAFAADEDDELDTTSFAIAGVDKVEDIKEDDVVTVYVGPVSGKITKLEVTDKVVTGKLESRTSSKITVAGTAYTYDGASLTLGKEYDVFFNYAGKVFKVVAVADDTTDEAYAVVLEANYEKAGDGWSGSTATETRQVKLLLATGEEVIYDVYTKATPATAALKFADAAAAKTWALANDECIVEFTLRDGKLDFCEPATTVSASATSVTKKGVLDGKYFASNAVIFVYDGEDYTILGSDKVASMDLDSAKYIVSSKGQIEVMFTGEVTPTVESVYGIYTGDWSEAKAGVYTLSFLVDGKATTYTAESKAFPEDKFAKLTFTGDKLTGVAVQTGVTAAVGGTVTGNTYAKGTDNYALEASVLVYIWDTEEEEYVIGTAADLAKSSNTSITLYDITSTPDSVYDVVYIVR